MKRESNISNRMGKIKSDNCTCVLACLGDFFQIKQLACVVLYSTENYKRQLVCMFIDGVYYIFRS